MSLNQALKFCDASSVDEMLNVYAHFNSEKKFEKNLIVQMADKPLERAASWILKHHLEQGFMLSEKNVSLLLKTFPGLEHWEARLHILQILPYIQFYQDEADELWLDVVDQVLDKNKLIRAWAYNGLHEIARQYPTYRQELIQFLHQASSGDEAPSVKARIRKIIKAGGYEL